MPWKKLIFSLHHPCDTVSDALLKQLPIGASVGNPFDILATGGEKELSLIFNYVEESKCYDGIIVIFGSPGLFDESMVFEYIQQQIENCELPVYFVMPSPINAGKELKSHLESGQYYFKDETQLVQAMGLFRQLQQYPVSSYRKISSKFQKTEEVLPQQITNGWLSAVDFALVPELQTGDKDRIETFFEEHKPVVLKAGNVVHKTDVGGVKLGLSTKNQLRKALDEISGVNGKSFIVQQEVSGFEFYLGVKYDEVLGHMIYFGKGGVNMEMEQDIISALFPLSFDEVMHLLSSIRSVWFVGGISKSKRDRPNTIGQGNSEDQ